MVENTIQRRSVKDDDGNEVKESNRPVLLNGTMLLLLEGEVFDIHMTKIDGEHIYNHVCSTRHRSQQAQAIFHDKLTFRPHSMNRQTHRKMTLSIADRVSKTGKIKILPVVGKDLESKKSELIKKEEKLRAQLRQANQQRPMRERSHARGLSANYLEPDRYDDEGDLEQSLLAMKKKTIQKGNYKRSNWQQ